VDIFITKNGFHTLMDLVITNPICTYMVQKTSTTTTHVMMMDIKKKHDPMLGMTHSQAP